MPPRSKVEGLPSAVKAWLDKALVEEGFTGYETLERELGARGFTIGKSSLHRYGSEFERRLSALKLASEQARAVVEAVPDDQNNMSEALNRVVQEKAFTMLVNMEGDPKASFAGLARIAVETAEATTGLKKYRSEVKRRTQAAAEEVTKAAKQGGLSAESVEEIRRKIMGITA